MLAVDMDAVRGSAVLGGSESEPPSKRVCSGERSVDAMAVKTEGRVLLPDTVVPTRYEIQITPDLERFDFRGKQRIFVKVCEATSEITLHAHELHFVSVSFIPSEGEKFSLETTLLNAKATTMPVSFV